MRDPHSDRRLESPTVRTHNPSSPEVFLTLQCSCPDSSMYVTFFCLRSFLHDMGARSALREIRCSYHLKIFARVRQKRRLLDNQAVSHARFISLHNLFSFFALWALGPAPSRGTSSLYQLVLITGREIILPGLSSVIELVAFH